MPFMLRAGTLFDIVFVSLEARSYELWNVLASSALHDHWPLAERNTT